MAKTKIAYVCGECGADFSKWQGQCHLCGSWDSIKEFKISGKNTRASSAIRNGYAGSGSSAAIQPLSDVPLQQQQRYSTGIGEFDRVLGGGFVAGEVVLLAGSPGSGKSTALLSVVANYVKAGNAALYVSGEESLLQIAERATRLGVKDVGIRMLNETCLESILELSAKDKASLIVIDSIQCTYSSEVDSAPGNVSQVRECAALLAQFAKTTQTIVIIIGHVTKDSTLAGPMTLSHIVDATIMLDSSDDDRFRIMRATKNRFGAVNELGLFAMTEKGMLEVTNPSAMFLSRPERPVSGSVICPVWEGTRPLLVEIQSLVVDAAFNPRRLAVGIDPNRLAMLLAVLNRHAGIQIADMDVFTNVVGGIKIAETAADLSVLISIISSLRDIIIPQDVVAFGEVGLSGEIRPIANAEQRIKDAFKHGIKRAIIPQANKARSRIKEGEVIGVGHISEVLEIILGFRDN